MQRQPASPELVCLREVEARMKTIDKRGGHLPNITGGAAPFTSVGDGKHK